LQHLIVEPIFMIALCYRYSTPIVPAIQWVLCNVVIGYGALNEFRECGELSGQECTSVER
jgi:hypothetical protein